MHKPLTCTIHAHRCKYQTSFCWIQVHKRFKRMLDKTQHANFLGESPLSSYKTTAKRWKKAQPDKTDNLSDKYLRLSSLSHFSLFFTFYVFGSCFRMLAAIFLIFILNYFFIYWILWAVSWGGYLVLVSFEKMSFHSVIPWNLSRSLS